MTADKMTPQLTRRDFSKHTLMAAGALTLSAVSLPLSSCASQDTIAVLVATLGSAGASVATALGATALAESIRTGTAAAVTAVKNWKAGTGTAQMAVQLLNVLLANLRLIPVSSLYATLIALAISTAVNIITILNAGTPAAMSAAGQAAITGGTPQDAAHFKARWNGICATNPELTPVMIH